MLNFKALEEDRITLDELVYDLTIDDLRGLTNEMVDAVASLISGCADADVVFEPLDPAAYDRHAVPEEIYMPWTLGHVIVHITASSEEAAALAAEMARGVPNHGRSRYEVPWRTVTTIAQCQERLAESRLMRLTSLDMWPDQPHLEITYKPWQEAPDLNAIGEFVVGLIHDYSHLEHIADIVRQATATHTALK